MREEIYMIPVNDGVDQGTECPFCAMYDKLEGDIVKQVMGSAYMDEDVRIKSDELGFCKTHIRRLYNMRNSLGVALMMHTHLKKVLKDIENMGVPKKKSLFGKKEEDAFEEYRKRKNNSCYICDKIELSLKRYEETFVALWKKDDKFREKVLASKGFCVEHYLRMMTVARQKLSEKDFERFFEEMTKLFNENMARVDGDIDWFEKKFDYRYSGESWKNSKDALPRTILKAMGYNVEEDNINGD